MNRFWIIIFLTCSILFSGAVHAGPNKIYLINGLLSKVFGYGLTNLSQKLPSARHFKFAGGVTQATINGIILDATRAYKADPSTRISLVGISQGGNAVGTIVNALSNRGVQVHYIAIIEASTSIVIPSNVHKADNFICTADSCLRNSVRRASGNSVTQLKTYNLNTGHIDSGNHPAMHRRVISQVR